MHSEVLYGIGLATITTPNVVTPRDGGPLSHFLNENNATTDEEEVNRPVTPYSNPSSAVVPVLASGVRDVHGDIYRENRLSVHKT